MRPAFLTDQNLMTVLYGASSEWEKHCRPETFKSIKKIISTKDFKDNKNEFMDKIILFTTLCVNKDPEIFKHEPSPILTVLNGILAHIDDKSLSSFLILLETLLPNLNISYEQFIEANQQEILLQNTGKRIVDLLKSSSNKTLIDSATQLYFEILNTNDNKLPIVGLNKDRPKFPLAGIILYLAKACAENTACNQTETNKVVAQIFGQFSRQLRSRNLTIFPDPVKLLEGKAFEFLNTTSTDGLNLFDSFVKGFFLNQTLSEGVKKACLNANISTEICERVTLDSIITTLAQTTPILTNPTTSPVIYTETTSSFPIGNPNITASTPFNVTSFSPSKYFSQNFFANNQTFSESEPTASILFPRKDSDLSLNLYSAGALGLTTGISDEVLGTVSAALLSIADQKKCSNFAMNSIKLTFFLLRSAIPAASPVLYAYAYDYLSKIISGLYEAEDRFSANQLIVSVSFSCLTALFHASDLLAKKPLLKNLIANISYLLIFSWSWMLPGDPMEKLSIHAVSTGGAITGKFATKGVVEGTKSLASFFRRGRSLAENGLEMESKLISTPSTRSTESNNSKQSGSTTISLPESDPTKVCYFIEPTKFNDIKNRFEHLIKVLDYIAKDYTKDIEFMEQLKEKASTFALEEKERKRDTITSEKNKLVQRQELLMEDRNHTACQGFLTTQAMVKDTYVEGLRALLDHIRRILEETRGNLNKTLGLKKDPIPFLATLNDEDLLNAALDTKLKFAIDLSSGLKSDIDTIISNYEKKENACQQNKTPPSQLFSSSQVKLCRSLDETETELQQFPANSC